MRPFRFGVVCSAGNRSELQGLAREVEQRGYSTLALTDHLDLSGVHVARLSWLPALASAAAVTTTLRLTTMVANHDLRHPAVLARDVATLDVLSEGRVELGIGAGWNPVEYDWAGIRLDPPTVRVNRVAEYVAIIRGLTDGASADPFDFDGEFFTIRGMPRVPASVQDPLPIVLGGSQRGMLSLAARLGDVVNLLTLRDRGSADEVYAEKVAWVRDAAQHAGRDPELATSIVLVATDRDDPVEAVESAMPRSPFAQHVAADGSIVAVASAPHVLAGSPGHIAEELMRRREAYGLSYYVMPAESLIELQPVVDALAGA